MTTPPSPSADTQRSRFHAHPGAVLALACVAQFMVVLDVSVVNVALPSIGRDLHYSATGLQWVVNAYVLTFAGFLLLGGRAADLFGRRKVFLFGLLLFSAASLWGGLSQSSGMLTAARAAQGLGGAVLSPATLTIIMTTFTEGERRNRALGAWSAVAGAGGAMGAIAGGLLTTYLSWRWVLFVNVPIGLLAGIATIIVLSEGRRPEAAGSLDIAGSLTVTGGLAVLVYAIVGTDTHAWTSGRTVGLLAVAAVLLVSFIVIQARFASAPLMPLGLFKIKAVSAANVVMLLVGSVFFAMWYFVSLYLQDVHGYGPLKTGLLFLPMSASVIVAAQTAGRLLTRVGSRALLVVGLVLAAAGFFWLSRLTATTGYAAGVLGGGVLLTLGVGLVFTPLATTATSGVHWTQAGLASGLLNTSRQVGGSLGLAVLATIATDRTKTLAAAHAGAGAALTAGFDRAFAVGAVLAVVAALAALALVPGRRPAGTPAVTPTGVTAPVGAD
ncbi:MAG TPA: MFS transporter [Acidimicrobiales bacterium]|nr:MFS transporter [Acidimicrobiales bacterium]